MISWQALTLNGFLRVAMKRHARTPLDLRRLRHAARQPPRFRSFNAADYRVDSVHTETGLRFDRVSARSAHALAPRCVALYLHGGAYLFGSPETHRPAMMASAQALNAPVFGLDYRLAPEHPFPAAADDAAQAYEWLLAQHPQAQIILMGDSAGGGLAIATALYARDRGLRPPAALIAFSPYCDLAVTGASIEANARSCAMLTPQGIRAAASMYLGGADPRDPRASPLYADLHDLPPMLLFASQHEILRDDTLRLSERAIRAGVSVEVIMRERLPHVWPIFVSILPEAREAFGRVASFVRHLDCALTKA
jgi:monoterpene epsilon-lactone hydrolase